MLVDHCKVKDTTNTADVPISSVTSIINYIIVIENVGFRAIWIFCVD